MTGTSEGPESPEVHRYKQRMRVGFVALHALPAIDPALARPVGGTETRAWMFARGLVQGGHCDVSFIARSDEHGGPFIRDGVEIRPQRDRLYSLYEAAGKHLKRTSRFPFVRLKSWHRSLLWQTPLLVASRLFRLHHTDWWRPDPAYARLPVDVFCTFGVQANSARVIASAHSGGKKAVLMIGSDGDLDERYQRGSQYVSPYGDRAEICYDILQRADGIVVQTPVQQRLLRERFGRDSVVIANPIDLDLWDAARTKPLPSKYTHGLERYALWVGRAEAVHKRPELLLEIARRCPQVDFLMILNPRDCDVEQRVLTARPFNVFVVPHVPFDLMPAVFSRAAVLVSTSALEGFPNVFLQAAASRVPIASLEVGGDFIAESGSGLCASGDQQRLSTYLSSVWADRELADRTGSSGRQFVQSHHGLSAQSAKLFRYFQTVLASEGRVA